MARIVVFGNSGSGKSTLAMKLSARSNQAHLDLDTIAWKPESPPQRMAIAESELRILKFTDQNANWVIEGCYSDLLKIVTPIADEILFLNLP